MLSCFHLIPERHGQTNRQTDGHSDGQNCYINIARQCADALTRDKNGTIRKLGCGFLFAFRSNYGSILHRDKARYRSKIVIFSYPLHSTPPLGGPRRHISIAFGVEKLVWWGYPMVKNFEDLCNRLDTIPACDRQTDWQTSCHGIVRAMHTRRAVKITIFGDFGGVSSHFKSRNDGIWRGL